ANSGTLSLYTGNSARETGDVSLYTGDSSGDNSGTINIYTGGGDLTSGAVSITSGAPFIDTVSTSGGVTIKTGGTASTANAGHSGNIVIGSGQGGTDESGSVSITTGDTSEGNSGAMYFQSGNSSVSGDSGALTIGSGTSSAGDSGAISIKTGYTPKNTKDSGAIVIATGGAEDGSGNPTDATAADEAGSGNITLRTGNTYDENSGYVLINTGSALDAGSDSGLVQILTGTTSTGTSGSVQVVSGVSTDGSSGTVAISSGSSTTGDSGLVMMTTGGSASGSYGTGPILVSTGDSTGNTNTGALMLSTGNTTGGDVGSVMLRTGIATDPAGVSDPAFARLLVQPKETRFSTGNMAGAGTVGGTDLFLEGGDAKLEFGSTPTDNTISGGNVVIKTGQVRIAGSGTFGSEDAGNILSNEGDPLGYGMVQDRGEIVITSKSVPPEIASVADQRILTVQADGVLKSLGIRILGHTKVNVKMSAQNAYAHRIPIFCKSFTQSSLDLSADGTGGMLLETTESAFTGIPMFNTGSGSWNTDVSGNLGVWITGQRQGDFKVQLVGTPIVNYAIYDSNGDKYFYIYFTFNEAITDSTGAGLVKDGVLDNTDSFDIDLVFYVRG
ncbi:MAG: hypothetical protein HOJ16_08580, partial [Candidatus Peribacter sp.]|nr:hypothetical protein [Candidatus Peribacter sp.]